MPLRSELDIIILKIPPWKKWINCLRRVKYDIFEWRAHNHLLNESLSFFLMCNVN